MPFKPAVSTLARQTIKTAFEELQQTITPADAKDFPSTTLDHVRNSVLEIENQLAARRCLRNMRRLSPFLKGLGHYAQVVKVLCNGTPFLPWIWAPITLILQVASDFVEAFEQIIQAYSRISSSLSRFEILSDTFIRDQDFQQTLAVFYADILQFHKHAYRFVKRSGKYYCHAPLPKNASSNWKTSLGWKLLFLTTWSRFQRRFDGILEDMKRHETLIDLEANARHIAESRKAHQDTRTWREEQLRHVAQFEEEQAAAHYQSILSWLKLDESDQLAIVDKICMEGEKYAGTCSWVLQHPKVNEWLRRQPEASFLWLQGTPGTGKSVISTQLVKFLRTNSFVIQHLCTSSHGSSIKYEEILKSLLIQLLKHDGELCAHVYKRCVLEKKDPIRSTLEHHLRTTFSSLSTEPHKTEYMWLVLDGVDECDDNTQKRIIWLMNQISSEPSQSGGTVCKVLISSRPSRIISSRLRRRSIVSLTDEKVSLEAAIRLYTSQRLGYQFQQPGQIEVNPDEMVEIQESVVEKADGMFLYARLVLDYVKANIFYHAGEIKSSVNQLPPKLNDFYREILSRILACLDSRSTARIKCVLGWIAFAKRPLQRLELLSAISFSEGTADVSHVAPRHILDVCGPLVEERRDTTLTFIHVSVKEFLQSSSSNLTLSKHESVAEHGAASVACLLSGIEVFEPKPLNTQKLLRVVKGLHGLHIYATEYWTEYLLSQAATPAGLETTSTFFTLACQLVGKLDASADTPLASAQLTEPRLKFLRQHPILHRQVVRALKTRSPARIESEYAFSDHQGSRQETSQRTRPPQRDGRRAGTIQKPISNVLLYLPDNILPSSNFGLRI
ncbi:hypothetical protein XA68_14769 [Ophiocordyceps unilateralis]|uniref:NACHT domain-containing protein n=1 Tax=Ophiocordyceps unilateralis TaxID=268505 RepID=A0A2A9P9U6_OPHUN|nr:hypothetical protein XA68_14769 [Ophiocordyceps unilateralis]